MKIGKCIPVLLCFVRMMAILWIVSSAAATSSPQLNITRERGILLNSISTKNCGAPRDRTDCDGEVLCVEINEIYYTCCAIEVPTVEVISREFPQLATHQNQTVMGSEHNRHAPVSAPVQCDGGDPVRAECKVCKLLEAEVLYKCCPGGGPAPT